MKVSYSKQIYKDLEKIVNDKKIIKSIFKALDKIKAANSINELPNVKKIKGYTHYYRIKIGDYRLGFKYDEETIILLRFLHRKDIYKKFPE